MPLTPFHLGPTLFFGGLFLSFINLPTFLIANIIIDLEPFSVLIFGINYPLHGFFHSFLGGSIIAIVLSLIMIKLSKKIKKLMNLLKLEQTLSKKSIFIASFIGIYLHIFLDSFLYTDIKPFFPLLINPFYNSSIFTGFKIYWLCTSLFFLGLIFYLYKMPKNKKAI